MMRTCTKCRLEKAPEEFYSHARYADGLKRQCKTCEGSAASIRQQMPEVRERRNELARAIKRPVDQVRRKHLWKYYHLTVERYEEILEAQGGVCAICEEPCPTGHNLSVDHDHECCPGKTSCGQCVRGLLCNRCNPMLGYAQDSPDRLFAALQYLNRPKMERAYAEYQAAMAANAAIGGA